MIDFEKVFSDLEIKKGDNILINSDIKKILIHYKQIKKKFDPNLILDGLLNIISKNGTLLLPTFNWDFCSDKEFDYLKTPSRSGSLTKIALSREDFTRTQNPIYSFAVHGEGKNFLTKLEHKNCFDLNSPFGFLLKNKGKNLFIDIDYKESLTFVHVAEQHIGVNYRYLKKFNSNYIDENNKKSLSDCTMYVRNDDFNGITYIDKKMDKILEENKAIKKVKIKNILFTIIDLPIAYQIMLDDLKKDSKIIYPKTINV
jgi:aminoglycoside 3-N-acetyltransferase